MLKAFEISISTHWDRPRIDPLGDVFLFYRSCFCDTDWIRCVAVHEIGMMSSKLNDQSNDIIGCYILHHGEGAVEFVDWFLEWGDSINTTCSPGI